MKPGGQNREFPAIEMLSSTTPFSGTPAGMLSYQMRTPLESA